MRTLSGTGACRIHHQRVSFDFLSFTGTLSVDGGDFPPGPRNRRDFRTFPRRSQNDYRDERGATPVFDP